jgi:CRISPR-associated protein Cmr2
MGQLLEGLKKPAEYRAFAGSVYDANKDAVFESLARNLRAVPFERKLDESMHPFEILSIGGDDLFMIVPAHRALKIACDIAKSVENRLRNDPQFRFEPAYIWEKAQRCKKSDGDVPAPQSKVSFSAGVVIADAHTPIFYLENLAGQLLKSAKSRAKSLKRKHNYYGGTIDFLALKSVTTLNGAVEQFRQTALNKEEKKLQLYARPYTLAEMEMLLETIRLLKRGGFPRNQLYRLRQSLDSGRMQSTLDYLYFLSRDEDVRKTREKIEERWPAQTGINAHPWRKQIEDSNRWETIWHDVMEIYDFVEEEERDANNQD